MSEKLVQSLAFDRIHSLYQQVSSTLSCDFLVHQKDTTPTEKNTGVL